VFPSISYLDWIMGRPSEATHDLGSSDLRRGGPAAVPNAVPPRLRDLPNPDDDTPLTEFVADEYGVEPSQVLVTAGATHANFLVAAPATAAAATDGEGDATGAMSRQSDATAPLALVEEPGYEPLVKTPGALGARVERFQRPDGARLDAELLAEAADDAVAEDGIGENAANLALVTVTNRHNPTGRLLTRETLADAAAVVGARGGLLHVDEVYAPYVLGGDGDSDYDGEDSDSDDSTAAAGRTAFGGPTAAGLPDTVVTGSLTKFHGLGGLRIGWLIGPEWFLARAEQVRNYVPSVAEPSAALARRFFANREELLAAAREHCRQNHEAFRAFAERRDDVSTVIHDGCPFGLVSHDSADGDAVSEAAWEDGVLVVPGRFFGMPEAVRVSLGRDPEHCRAALSAFGDVLDGL
jgi:aspartate/methionine/tyrosine aminotransferase